MPPFDFFSSLAGKGNLWPTPRFNKLTHSSITSKVTILNETTRRSPRGQVPPNSNCSCGKKVHRNVCSRYFRNGLLRPLHAHHASTPAGQLTYFAPLQCEPGSAKADRRQTTDAFGARAAVHAVRSSNYQKQAG